MTKHAKKVVLAYSGGLDTSIIIPWLKENYGCEVIAYAADVGQGQELEGLRDKAIKTGASKIYIEDLRKEFLTDYVFPMVQAGAIYEGKYLLGTSIARPLIAKRMMDIVAKEGADAVAHGCTGKGNDQVRFELTFKAIDPKVRIIAPWREWDIKSREDAIDYAAQHKVPIVATKEKLYSNDRNLWHLSTEGGILENPWNEPPKDLWQMTVAPEDAPNTAEYIELDFEAGVPVALNGEKLDPVLLVETLNKLGGKHGIGRVDIVENRLVGMKSRGVYETPGGDIIVKAHAELESLVLDRDTQHFKQDLALKYADLVYNGQWFTQIREALDGFIKETQKRMTGRVRLKLYKGNCTPVGRTSPYSLYREDFATFSRDEVYNQRDAEGFINLFALPLTVRALVGKKWS
ncbi:MAG: argininosuccinate synthase [Deltaproteobacteria bacterium CG11_big_fil_rev_8_21_14_0_20_47_16]|nr:MAG: argininosuccinate synthase [Deltaproteobacteria bacterium CG11_big_fil_rev_8_21_14_0_20_47_16]